MKGQSLRRGNYEYATTRVKAKKSSLLTKDNYPKLLMMDLNEIGRFMGETKYKVEMTELATRYSGVDLIELGVSKNLARTYREVISFCTGDLRDMVSTYLRRWDFWNIKTILRGKYSGASLEEIQEDLVPAGNLNEESLNSLISLNTPREVLDALTAKGDMHIPEELLANFEKGGTLAPIEDYFDKFYYERLLAAVMPDTKPKRDFLTLIKREIDITNLRTLLKLKQANIPAEKIRTYLIKGGRDLDLAELNRLAGLETFDQLIDELSKLPFYNEIKEGVETAKQTGNLSEAMLALQHYLVSESEKFSHMYPLSVLPVIDFLIRKRIEVDNLRIIARGKASGMQPDAIKKLLVM
jgi:V/A-type H+-transporting ATPase subunit C